MTTTLRFLELLKHQDLDVRRCSLTSKATTEYERSDYAEYAHTQWPYVRKQPLADIWNQRPLTIHCGHSALAYHHAMSGRGIAFTLATLVLLLAAMFYSGMFMHGD